MHGNGGGGVTFVRVRDLGRGKEGGVGGVSVGCRASRSSTESFSRTIKEYKCQEHKLHTTKVANRRDYMLKYGLCVD